MDLFSVLAHEDAEGKANLRKATSVATKRVTEQFGSFLAGSDTAETYAHRYEHISEELESTVETVANEYGVEAGHVLKGVEARFKRQPEPTEKTASTEHEARRPKLCPYHSEVTDISLAQGEPRAGFDAMAQHAWGAQHCQGGEYEGGRCNFKREMVTQEYWDAKAEQAEERRQEREEQRQLEQEQQAELQDAVPTEESVPAETLEDGFEAEPTSEPVAEVSELPVAEEPQAEVPMAMAASSDQDAPLEVTAEQKQHLKGVDSDKRQRQYEHIKASCLADGKSEDECKELAARTVNKQRAEKGETKGSRAWTAEALETVDIEKDTLPEFDRSIDAGEPADTEMDGSPHPTRRRDITEPIIPENAENPFEETDAVLEKQDVEKADPVQHGQGGSWSGNSGVNPVSHTAGPEADTLDGFEDDSIVQDAINRAR